MPHNVVETYYGECQHEGNECAQQAIHLSLLVYLNNRGTIIAHWPVD